ncbi:acyl-CoA dehydrogenase [Mycobacterium sp. CBMA293]|uniref:acyl-CoA dehydrogenase family protein n=1 Tax=unclassified Mycolicibacterium TaxID=2636767 RepID=UPI0012DE6C11|nr:MULTISPECIES: acyl-CoA dehydrogenase family protein [unclassified Mycolicibacterium]MUL44927.1 acyl-CoA dehydrogenase [Mycolicibacterium sp. CBMA 360]MUL57964.1 acyl-CoA dehydrogenase [Mycolicibacterium sp. CBMA 335]MUL73422.1 acyl-CoA dehydrogenase [Mycolicibacterium sp. CBMA 311]MUL95520.1 acyl-CoA dehydrogenase [Mycolicibacterium sp. CBMA 230]MUM07395.1 acyl-CoA dehydrogenase [Mycolicibacterium sp. CBMA 213]
MVTGYWSPWVDDEIDDLKAMATKFFNTEALPHRERWEQQKCVDREFWLAAGQLGLLCAAVPEEYGGGGGTIAHDFAIMEAQAYCGESGFGNQVHSGLVAHYLLAYGSHEQKLRWLPKMATGELVGAIAMSEAGGGSDLKALRTTAIRDGDHYLLNGSKTFISNGSSADIIVLVVKTDPGAGAKGVSLLVLETADAEGFRVGRVLDKLGMKAQDTAELFFDNVRVPAENLLGEEGAGYGYAMKQLAHERLVVAVCGLATLERAVDETVAYTQTREAFGGPLFEMQNTRFELADCATIARVARTFVDDCVVKHLRGELNATTASMAKSWVTDMQCQVIDRCLQLFGGYGYMLEYPITRMFADSRAQRIYAGTNEVMKELIARSL